MYRCESWTIKKAECFWIVVLKKTLESPLDRKEIKPVNPKGDQPWIFIGRTDADPSILCPHDVKSQLTGKDPDAGKDWGQEEKGVTEDEMVGWHHQLKGHEFEQDLGTVEDREVWCAAVQGITKSWTWLSIFGHNELTHWKSLWCWKGLGVGEEGDDRGWDGWMVSPTQWTWVWVNSGSWWWTGRPGMLRFMGSQSRTWLSSWTELNWTE